MLFKEILFSMAKIEKMQKLKTTFAQVFCHSIMLPTLYIDGCQGQQYDTSGVVTKPDRFLVKIP